MIVLVSFFVFVRSFVVGMICDMRFECLVLFVFMNCFESMSLVVL